jgi:hypothetical protein
MFFSKRSIYLSNLSLMALAMLVFLAGCGHSSSVGQVKHTEQTEQTNRSTLVLDLEVDRYEFNTPADMCQAAMVADVVAGSIGQGHWNTTNKAQPSVLSQSLSQRQVEDTLIKGGYMIYTPLQFTRMKVLLDHRSTRQPPEEFVMVGGQQGTTKITVGEYPFLKTSTRYLVVFVLGLNASTHQLTQQWLLVYNAFPIDAQDMILLQQAGSSKEPGPGQPRSEVKVALTALQQQLAACH